MKLACMAAIVHAHKSARVVDEESVERYETRMLSEEHDASSTALVECATFYHLTGGPDAGKAKEMVRRALNLDANDQRGKTLLGWIEMTGRGDGDVVDEGGDEKASGVNSSVTTSTRSATSRRRAAAAVRLFDEVLRSPDRGGEAAIDALLGKARAMSVLSRYDAAVDAMNVLGARHPGFSPASSERAKARLAASDFEGAEENARRGLEDDPDDVECHRVLVFVILARGFGDDFVRAARRQISVLEGSLDRREPKNVFLHLRVSKEIARVAGGDAGVLDSCARLLDKARRLKPEDVHVLRESAYQARLRGRYGEGLELYGAAATATATEREGHSEDLSSAYGTVLCLILEGRLSEAQSRLEFLGDIAKDENDVVFAFLCALRAHIVNARDADEKTDELERRLTPFLESVNKKPPAIDFFVECDPDALIRMAAIFSERDGAAAERFGGDANATNATEARGEDEENATPRALRILETLCRRGPGLLHAQEQLMRARFVAGAMDAAARTANALLRLNDAHAEAHVTLARVHLARGAHVAARRALDAATANDFSVRESTAYRVVSANCRAAEGDSAGALEELAAAMRLPGVRRALTPEDARAAQKNGGTILTSTADRASTFVAYARALVAADRGEEAETIIDQAAKEFSGTASEITVMIARCEMAVARGDESRALRALSKVPPSSPHYPAATVALAKMHLEVRGDKDAFIRCHEDLAEHRSVDPNSWIRLAEAYERIDRPESAVGPYERA
jgi:tetratricopeptide repeat protein 21B